MFTFVLGILIIVAGLIASMIMASNTKIPKIAVNGVRVIAPLIGLIMIFISTAIYVEDNQAGVVTVKFGTDLPTGQIVATNGEKGPQAKVLPPGWHFGYWPWQYNLEEVPNIEIPQGHVGVVESKDGAHPLPKGEIFASEWENPTDMLDAQKFMKEGTKGPQLTVLTPGQYRYNPRLFKITAKKALEVPIGTVAVIKANAGKIYDGDDLRLVNGVPMVPQGYRGIWSKALSPNAYYLHPDAYIVTFVQTTNRIYNYVEKNAIGVKTLDSFEFPVDVRVSVKVSAENASDVVAMLAAPDEDRDKNGFNILEERVILPLIRAIFRNTAESMKAIEYVQRRSEIEQTATDKFAEGLAKFKITSDGVYVGELGIRDTAEGKLLLQTQTDKEVAIQQKETYEEKRLAEIERSKMVEAEENANQEKNKAIARAQVDIAEQEAQAAIKRATGEAEAYNLKLEALGGVDNFVKLELFKILGVEWKPELPSTLVIGGGGDGDSGALDALIVKMLSQGETAKKSNKK
jgi:regulator of protease activity HflC (stomatin/prohibitin superfamily)